MANGANKPKLQNKISGAMWLSIGIWKLVKIFSQKCHWIEMVGKSNLVNNVYESPIHMYNKELDAFMWKVNSSSDENEGKAWMMGDSP